MQNKTKRNIAQTKTEQTELYDRKSNNNEIRKIN